MNYEQLNILQKTENEQSSKKRAGGIIGKKVVVTKKIEVQL